VRLRSILIGVHRDAVTASASRPLGAPVARFRANGMPPRDAQQVLAQLDEDSIVYKLNTLPLPRCLLLSRADELRDGLVFAEILCVCDRQLSAKELAALPPVERLSLVVRRCRKSVPTDHWPAILEEAGAAEAIHAGDLSSTRSLAELLYALWRAAPPRLLSPHPT
jgi:hypothetical protein